MAKLSEDYDRMRDAQRMEGWTNRFTSARNELNDIFTNLENTRDKYESGSDEYTELQQKITQGKTVLQNMLDSH